MSRQHKSVVKQPQQTKLFSSYENADVNIYTQFWPHVLSHFIDVTRHSTFVTIKTRRMFHGTKVAVHYIFQMCSLHRAMSLVLVYFQFTKQLRRMIGKRCTERDLKETANAKPEALPGRTTRNHSNPDRTADVRADSYQTHVGQISKDKRYSHCMTSSGVWNVQRV